MKTETLKITLAQVKRRQAAFEKAVITSHSEIDLTDSFELWGDKTRAEALEKQNQRTELTGSEFGKPYMVKNLLPDGRIRWQVLQTLYLPNTRS